MNENDYRNEIIRIADKYLKLGMDIVRSEMGEKKRYISQSAAYKMFGRNTVRRWFEEGRINPAKHGNKLMYDSLQLQSIAIAFNQPFEQDKPIRKSNAGRKPKVNAG